MIFGTRPEAIKMAPLIHKIRRYKNKFNLLVCVTGQHRKMLDQVLTVFKIKPEIDLDIMKKNQDLTQITTLVMNKIKNVINLRYLRSGISLYMRFKIIQQRSFYSV